ncbi:MAG: MATE family efflux transporter [Candidatus Omnitrophica bacterium]|nr:MATE family efflux transporter [Candidatus Omnitrophota bacterium]
MNKLLKVSSPLIISSSIWTIQYFLDRMFISWYSVKSIAAVLPASFLNMTSSSIFIGTAQFINTFVAQYYGGKIYDKIGEIVWQGLYLSIIGGLFHLFLIPFAPYIFKIFGHEESVVIYETIYFQILCLGTFSFIGSTSISSFFSGIGKTYIVLIVSFIQTLIHLTLSYLFIFGKLFFPEMGIKGAGIATIISSYFSFFIYFILFFRKKNFVFGIKKYRFNKQLFKDLLKYGIPNGIYLFIDISVWTIFLLIMGKLGIVTLSSSNIAFNINIVAFMPMLGIGTGVSILVGQYIGEGKKEKAKSVTFIGFWITFVYMFLIALTYILFPNFYINFFKPKVFIENFEEVKDLAKILLRFIAFYSVFDTMNVIFLSALKGAGDTKFIMNVFLFSSIFVFLIPVYISVSFFPSNIIPWSIVTFYVTLCGFIFFIRFLKGGWEKIKIIGY